MSRRKRLAEGQTVGDTFRWPVGRAVTTDIDHRQVRDELSRAAGKMPPVYWPGLEAPAGGIITRLARSRSGIGRGASLLKVFWPYLTWNTVFDNTRVTSELGRKPVPFSRYSYPLLKFSRETNFSYNYEDWPKTLGGTAA